MKNKTDKISETILDYSEKCKQEEVLYSQTQDEILNGRSVVITGRKAYNLGNCSYLGLELDKRIIDSASDYMYRYGVQFSSSRTFLRLGIYEEYENLLSHIFSGKPVITFVSVTNGHSSVLPVIVSKNDLVILDQQVHASVKTASNLLVANGTTVETIRHNRIDQLEDKIKLNYNRFEKIWYLMDGIYSMYGDLAPFSEVERLLDKYPKFHLYADDAHGMSIAGENGSGMLLSRMKFHDRLILATSLNKAFATGGGAFVFPNQKLADRVRSLAGAYIFSGHQQVATIGAGIESARIHLSDEIYKRQKQLQRKVKYCYNLLKKHQLPNVSDSTTPIFFIAVGKRKAVSLLCQALRTDGLFVNPGIFPAVPDQGSGIRFTITLHNTYEDINYLVERIAYHMPIVFRENGFSVQDIKRGFKYVSKFDNLNPSIPIEPILKHSFKIQYENFIRDIDSSLWNQTIGSNSINDYSYLQFLESVFVKNKEIAHNWKFHYLVISDNENIPTTVTYFVECLIKEDAFSSIEASKEIEEIRRTNPYYLTAKALIMGATTSTGNNLYVRDKSKKSKEALNLLLDKIQEIGNKNKIDKIILRDFKSEDQFFKDLFLDQGLQRLEFASNHVWNYSPFINSDEFVKNLKGDNRKSTSERKRFVRKRAIEKEGLFEVQIIKNPSKSQAEIYYKLYLKVKNRSLEINDFGVPINFFQSIETNDKFEVIEIKFKSVVIGTALCYISHDYHFLTTGMDYNYIETDIYSQIIWQCIKRGNELKKNVVLGFTASQNKRKFGAEVTNNSMYTQNSDSFNQSVLGMHGKKNKNKS